MHCKPAPPRLAQGSALVFILILLVAGAAFLVSALRSNPQIERDKVTADALAQAKEALIGFAATYRDTHPGMVFGYLPCPDTNNDGAAEANCGAQDVSLIGRLPWRTLGLPPLRDSSGECLWYAVSGRYKDNSPTAALNWDTTGQFIIQDADGAALANGVIAVVFAARGPNAGQARVTGANECGGDGTNNINAYLDGNDIIYTATPAANADSTLTLSSLASIAAGTNNDRGLWIAPNEIWERVRRRADFPGEINNLLNSVKDCLIAQTTLPDPVTIDFSTLAETPVTSGSVRAGRLSRSYIGNDGAICLSPWQSTWNNIWWVNFLNYTGRNFYANWQDNLLYVKCGTGNCLTVNTDSCRGVLIFAGQNSDGTQRLASEKNDPSKYLESQNYTSFISAGATYSGTTTFDKPAPSVDVVACIPPIGGGGGGTTIAFSNPTDFSRFEPAGAGVTVDPDTQTAHIDVAGGSNGGCFWFPDPLTTNGKTLRAFYEFKFRVADPPGGVDYGYGFTFSLLEGGMGKPTLCSSQSRLGVIPTSSGYLYSLFVETDIRDNSTGETAPNHTAIMANGNIDHSATNGNLTAACNGTAAGCNHSPSNKFEEDGTPVEEYPLWHNQRVEIHSGYDSTCTATGGTYSLVKVWVDCLACTDTAANFASTPTVRRCINLDSAMNEAYFGFTAGFSSSGGNVQGVSIKSLDLRVD